MTDRQELWRRFRDENPDLPAKEIEDLWQRFAAQNGADGVTAVPKRRGRPPKAASSAEQSAS